MMATDPRFDADFAHGDAPTQRKSGWSTCLVGCLVTLVIMLVLAVLVGVWVARHWRDWASTFAAQAIKQEVDASELLPEEKQEIKGQVDRVADAFRDGRLSNEKLILIFEKLVDSPLMTTLVASAVERTHFARSGLNDEEKAEGRNILQRFLRGAFDGKIDEESIDSVIARVADRQADGSWRLRNQLSDDELRAFLEAAKLQADQAGIPEEPPSFEPAAEVKRIVDEAMNEP